MDRMQRANAVRFALLSIGNRPHPERRSTSEVIMKIDESYKEMLHNYPPPVLIETARECWDKSEIIHANDIDPMRNTKGLYWRLTGIGKEQVEWMPNPAFEQMNAMENTGSMRFSYSRFGLSGLLGPGASASDLNTSGWFENELRNYSASEEK